LRRPGGLSVVTRLAAAGLAVLAAGSAGAAAIPPDLAQTVHAYDHAQTRNDIARLSTLVSDDFILVNSNASVEDRAQFLADFNLPGFRIEPYSFEQKIDRAWGDGAVTGGLLHLSWTQDGQHQTRVLRIAYVWRKRAGRWQAVYAQVTRVP
jgi:ketosteroid isomerase-like protein